MTSIIGKTFRINSYAPSSTAREMDEQELIRNLDYAELEEKFQIHKYYPAFIHNKDCLTPRLKAMICDKPIYSKAAVHTKKPEKAKKTQARKSRREEQHRLRTEHIQEKRDLRHEHKKEKHQLRAQHREERKSGRVVNPAKNIEIPFVEHVECVADDTEDSDQSKIIHEKEPANPVAPAGKAPSFNNPFGSGQITLVANNSNEIKHDRVDPRSDRNLNRRTSISERLKGLFIKKPVPLDIPAKRSMSFDQTKTNLTNSRAAEHAMMKLTENRRPSDDIRTYFFFLTGFGSVSNTGDQIFLTMQ